MPCGSASTVRSGGSGGIWGLCERRPAGGGEWAQGRHTLGLTYMKFMLHVRVVTDKVRSGPARSADGLTRHGGGRRGSGIDEGTPF